MKLDIGCGTNPTGDVNCDLFTGKSPHICVKNRRIKPRTIPNFIRCDINNLPFRDAIFSECYCSHVLEHKGVKVKKAINEMLRVSYEKVTIVVPHRFRDRTLRKWKMHTKRFNLTNMSGLLRKMNLDFDISLSYKCFPHSYICLIRFPDEITVTIRKRKFLT